MLIQTPRGTKDILPEDYKFYKFVERAIDAQAEINGFERIEPPIFEYESIFTKGIGDSTDIVEKEMYEVKRLSKDEFQGDEEEKLILRPEYTGGIVRAYLEHGMKTWPQPVQLYSFGPVFRYDRPQKGRFRQFWQFDFEQIGSSDPVTDARMISLVHSICKALRLNEVEILINSLGCKNCQPNIRVFLKDLFDKKKIGLCNDCINRLNKNPLRILDCKEKKCQRIAKSLPPLVDHLCEDCKDHFEQVLEFLDEARVSYDLEPRLIRGLDYYTRTVFEVIEQRDKSRQNALIGGGRYDNLIEVYGGKFTPAIGFAGGVERIIEIIKKKNIKVDEAEKPQVFVAQLGEKAKRKSITLLELLQSEGIPTKAALSKNNLKSQLRLADKYGVKITVIIGQREVIDDTAIIRDMKEGIQEVVEQEELLDRIKRKLNLKK